MKNRNESKTRGRIPKLRFPEFQDASEWEESKLSDVSMFVKERISLEQLTLSNYISTENILPDYSGVTIISKLPQSGTAIRFRKYDILISNIRPYLKKIWYSDKEGGASNDVLVIRPNTRVKSVYLSCLLKSDDFIHYVMKGAKGLKMPRGDISLIKDYPIAVPSTAEQHKIADCLTSLDTLIAAHARKLDALKAHKHGLMQQLFPADGDTAPRLRFPEFRDAGEWEEKLIEDFFLVGSSKRVLQENWTTHGVPFYRTRELVSLSKNEPFSSEIFISEELFSEISQQYGLPTEGDFLVSGVGTLGISYQVQAGDKFYFKDGNVLWFKSKKGIVSTYFKYCFESDGIQSQILAQASISTVGTYTIQNAKKTKFWYPPDIKEQQKIADCLSALDDLIALQTRAVATLNTHKQGLLQQLFPAADEAAG